MKACSKPFRSGFYEPQFGDIIHSTDGGNGECSSAWMVLGRAERYTSNIVLEVMLLEGYTRPGKTSICSIRQGSAWHLAEKYAPKEP